MPTQLGLWLSLVLMFVNGSHLVDLLIGLDFLNNAKRKILVKSSEKLFEN